MQQEVVFDLQSCWSSPYGCSSTGEMLGLTIVSAVVLLCFTPQALRPLLQLSGEPRTLAEEIGVPADLVLPYVVAWMAFSGTAVLWALSSLIEDPRPTIIEDLARVGGLAFVAMFVSGFVSGVTLAWQLLVRKFRRSLSRPMSERPNRPAWKVLCVVGVGAGGWLGLSLGLFLVLWILGLL